MSNFILFLLKTIGRLVTCLIEKKSLQYISMKGVILSGGKGSRLAPITDNYPKQLVPILGKPILFHCIDYLKRAGIDEIAIILSPETGKIIEAEIAKTDFGVNFEFIYQDEPRGLAHAVKITQNFVGDEEFVVLLGDNLFNKSLKEILDCYKASKSDSLILLKSVDRPYNFGVAKFDSDGKVQKLVEKPKTFVSNYAIVGVYCFNHKIFNAIDSIEPSARGELEITDAIAHQVENGQNVQTSILDSFWFDSGTREGLLDANKHLLIDSSKYDNNSQKILDSKLLGNIALGEGSIVENSNLMGPIYIGKNVKVLNSIVGPFTTIADDCVIEDSELQEVIAMENTKMKGSQVISSVVFKDLSLNGDQLIINKLLA